MKKSQGSKSRFISNRFISVRIIPANCNVTISVISEVCISDIQLAVGEVVYSCLTDALQCWNEPASTIKVVYVRNVVYWNHKYCTWYYHKLGKLLVRICGIGVSRNTNDDRIICFQLLSVNNG